MAGILRLHETPNFFLGNRYCLISWYHIFFAINLDRLLKMLLKYSRPQCSMLPLASSLSLPPFICLFFPLTSLAFASIFLLPSPLSSFRTLPGPLLFLPSLPSPFPHFFSPSFTSFHLSSFSFPLLLFPPAFIIFIRHETCPLCFFNIR